MSRQPRLLIAASGTGGHLFPALAVAKKLNGYHIQWLGVPHRLEASVVPSCYPLHTVDLDGLQTNSILNAAVLLVKMLKATIKVYRIINREKIQVVFTTGGYIAAPAIIAAKLARIPVILHESNCIPGKVTRWFASWCDLVAVGFHNTQKRLKRATTQWISTPVREEFLEPQPLELDIPENVPLVVAMGGSQGAVALNKLVRRAASRILSTGAYLVHLTGSQDEDFGTFSHPRYLEMPFYDKMAALLQRANLAISRAGASSLTELAITRTPSIVIPYPFAADDHQFYNGQEFVNAGASLMFRQEHITPELLAETVIYLLQHPDKLSYMAQRASLLASPDSANILAEIISRFVSSSFH
ncbi:MAG: undecaprenyldiphospho-muramoylpentapeptide beta-N-acetylglucosaminyltransferase [Geminocystis sp.]|nr:undecaprenyldiphospho-muramoylpentapeptide beta-N-acetylglucosaminyltransferase [Geminocystis sp.]MCX8079468.1 undecaprenyldiphospho-muramoylpentapeptide beta-N-acetylglucosaminyltransferase [Geminocystis sp.]MDW8114915.1 undecaprenyldiphospho-muramoylpentapeptide beta-N-acetylglucosaminyltransferase [Geminocystis sp.]